MYDKLLAMLQMQDATNRQVNPQWEASRNPWYRAIWIEAAEMADHHGYKWWKKQARDVEQMRMELVDIWHFVLSHYLQVGWESGFSRALTAKQLEQDFTYNVQSDGDALASIEELVLAALSGKPLSGPFRRLMADIDMSLDDLYRAYIGKNVLNGFRQDHGYKDGSYVKLWDGREDNEHLVEIVAELDTAASDFREQLYAGLAERYAQVTAAA